MTCRGLPGKLLLNIMIISHFLVVNSEISKQSKSFRNLCLNYKLIEIKALWAPFITVFMLHIRLSPAKVISDAIK